MKEFISEYGLAILVIVVILIMIGVTTPLGDMFTDAMKGMFSQLTGIYSESETATTDVAQILNQMSM